MNVGLIPHPLHDAAILSPSTSQPMPANAAISVNAAMPANIDKPMFLTSCEAEMVGRCKSSNFT